MMYSTAHATLYRLKVILSTCKTFPGRSMNSQYAVVRFFNYTLYSTPYSGIHVAGQYTRYTDHCRD